MSNAGQVALGIVGTVVGFVAGGPTGAAYGLQIGLAVGSVVSPTQLPGTFGPRLNDKRTTTAQLGEPVTELFGTDVVAGTVIWLGDIAEHAVTEEVGGKGGPEGENTTFNYTQSIAVGLCRGPQFGLMRVWENGKLVYDARPQQAGETDEQYSERFTAAATYAEGFTLYLGDEEQLPDPTIELKEGVGNVPAYRGLMYIVYTDRLLKDEQGQRHPSFKFEIAAAPIPDLRQVPAETLRASFILRAGASDFGGDITGYSNVPFFVFGTLFSTEVIGGPGSAEIVGGFVVPVRQVIFGGNTFPPLSFGLILDGFYYNLIKKVEYDGPVFLGTPTVFDTPTSAGTFRNGNGDNTSFEVSPTSETPFLVGVGDYLVTIESTRPAGRLSMGEVTVATVSPLGAPIHGYNSGAYSSAIGAFGSFTGTVDVGEEEEAAVLGFYVETAGGAKLHLVLDGSFASLQIYVMMAGNDGEVIFGPFDGSTAESGLTRFTWDCQATMLSAPNIYEVNIVGVGVVPFSAAGNPPPTLEAIVETICSRCGLDDVDASDLADVAVYGYKVDRITDGRSAIQVLRQIGFFDSVESGGQLKFVRRGHAPARTLTAEDLGAHEYGRDVPPAVTTASTQDVELPRQLCVQYRDPARDYEDGQQASPTRLITDAVNDKYVDVAVAIDGTQAIKAAEMLWADEWAGRWKHTFQLDAAH